MEHPIMEITQSSLPEMTAPALLELLQVFDAANIQVWLDGG
jgi:hypothetical protein